MVAIFSFWVFSWQGRVCHFRFQQSTLYTHTYSKEGPRGFVCWLVGVYQDLIIPFVFHSLRGREKESKNLRVREDGGDEKDSREALVNVLLHFIYHSFFAGRHLPKRAGLTASRDTTKRSDSITEAWK